MDMKIFASRLKEVRLSRNISAVELARAINCDTGTIHRWERATFKSIKESKLEEVANYLNVNKDYLTGASEDKHTLDSLDNLLISKNLKFDLVLDFTKEFLTKDKINYEGKELTEEDIKYILNVMDVTMEIITKNRKK